MFYLSVNSFVFMYKMFLALRTKNIKQDIFSLKKLSTNSNGHDYLITCSWTGDTFIVDQKGNLALFKLGENVSGFCTGMYTVKANTRPVPSFVFITMKRKVCKLF